MDASKTIKSREYLDKTFLEELNHKIWCTKGARFSADARFKKKSKLSNISISLLSAYLIIAGLLSVYNINQTLNINIINYLVTALSILVLVVNMYESNQEYNLRAANYHSCGIELAEIYNTLRIFKTSKNVKSDEEVLTFCKNINQKYQAILNKYENHERLDYNTFRIQNLYYFEEELKPGEIQKIKRKLNWNIYGWYFVLITATPIIILLLIILT